MNNGIITQTKGLLSQEYVTLAEFSIMVSVFGCLIYVICIYLHIVMSNTLRCVFALFFFFMCTLCCQFL